MISVNLLKCSESGHYASTLLAKAKLLLPKLIHSFATKKKEKLLGFSFFQKIKTDYQI